MLRIIARLGAALWIGAGAASLAAAQIRVPMPQMPPAPVPVSEAQLVALAKQLIRQGELDDAEAALLAVRKRGPIDPIEINFLLAQIAERRLDYDRAIAYYREILINNPNVARVRLELARLFFLDRDDANAKAQFEYVLATDPPAPVQANIRRFLREIEQRKRWSVRFAVAAVPDSNSNAAAADDERLINFGGLALPFTADEAARASSAFGINVTAGGSYFFDLGPRWKYEINADASHTEFITLDTADPALSSDGTPLPDADDDFDQTSFTVATGPRYLLSTLGVVRVLGIATRRRFQETGLLYSAGGRAVWTQPISPRLTTNLLVQTEYFDFDTIDTRDGLTFSAQLAATYGIGAASQVTGLLNYTQEFTEADFEANRRYRIGAGYRRELPLGVTANLFMDFTYRPFMDENPIFPLTATEAGQAVLAAREEYTGTLTLDFTLRGLSIYGFAPVLSYSFARNDSNIDIFDFSRQRGNVGLTRVF